MIYKKAHTLRIQRPILMQNDADRTQCMPGDDFLRPINTQLAVDLQTGRVFAGAAPLVCYIVHIALILI